MPKKTNSSSSVKTHQVDQKLESRSTDAGRRKAVGTILAGSSVTAVMTAGSWSKPVIDAVMLPAHAQTSVASLVLGGNIDLTPVASNVAPKTNDILDFFIGSAHAQSNEPDLGGACLTMTINGNTFVLNLDFVSEPRISIEGTISGNSFSGSGDGVSISGSINLGSSPSKAAGRISNTSGAYNFAINSDDVDCGPLAPATTPAPTTTAEPTTTAQPTTTAAPTTTPAP